MLSWLFSRLWQLGDLDPWLGGFQNEAGKLRIFMGFCKGISVPGDLRAMANMDSNMVSESARMCTMGPTPLSTPSWGLLLAFSMGMFRVTPILRWFGRLLG